MQKSDFIMLPYWDADKEDFRFSPSMMTSIYRQIVEECGADTVFYNGAIKNETDWISYCRSKDVCLFIVFKTADHSPACVIWIDRFRDKTAHYNYAAFKSQLPQYKDAVRIGHGFIQDLLSIRDTNGFILDSMIGMTPVANRRSTLFALHCGGKFIGTLPKGVWVAKNQKSEPCHIISFERDSDENL